MTDWTLKNVFRKIDGEKNKTHLRPTTQKSKLSSLALVRLATNDIKN